MTGKDYNLQQLNTTKEQYIHNLYTNLLSGVFKYLSVRPRHVMAEKTKVHDHSRIKIF